MSINNIPIFIACARFLACYAGLTSTAEIKKTQGMHSSKVKALTSQLRAAGVTPEQLQQRTINLQPAAAASAAGQAKEADQAQQQQQQQVEAIAQQLGRGTPLAAADPAFIFCFVALPGRVDGSTIWHANHSLRGAGNQAVPRGNWGPDQPPVGCVLVGVFTSAKMPQCSDQGCRIAPAAHCFCQAQRKQQLASLSSLRGVQQASVASNLGALQQGKRVPHLLKTARSSWSA